MTDDPQIATRSETDTLMHAEAAEASAAVRRLIAANGDTLAALGARLRAAPPAVVVTCARGSSDHAATYGKYLIETLVGVPVASAAPSVASVYEASVTSPAMLCIAISQSGRSPDLLASVAAQKAAGAHVVALVNDTTSPLAEAADTLVPLMAGPEKSVAATKSYITALAALALLAAEWAGDDTLKAAVRTLPDRLAQAWSCDWSAGREALVDATNLFVIGRGFGLAIAQEAALKLKETCALHAEGFSAAEVRHGPMEIVDAGFPLIAFATSDSAGDGVREAAAEFTTRSARVLLADAKGGGTLPALADHPAIEPILMIQSFYRMANALSVARGLNPDAPRHLSKVTRTL
ncbi:SIS domain-containing protein [Sphingomonas carotinifaciens]|uniref:Glutamine--fructose-6-phosphate transaminase n=1 Tax=Sphingomonas carotinifaciens TaxID=1166323 RepID=A0A1G7L3B5_9SPHN|nr:SIS domain-containing protein [Sphingomonas carotinifaciens]MBB4085519.1 glucosamine--fructose-6-phosphate aminotransferase (isomerizing) [Sphingomonas carotinifaciens]MWC43460.1 SIS domain-containing protein [Sphingomonas carotinifaciens]SDF43988.1 glutamine--fructose-6-phosphate transaminase [Sphingomonas carotinifaciens]